VDATINAITLASTGRGDRCRHEDQGHVLGVLEFGLGISRQRIAEHFQGNSHASDGGQETAAIPSPFQTHDQPQAMECVIFLALNTTNRL